MLLRLKETKTILLPTLQHKFESFACMQSDIHGGWWVWSWPSASRARARCPCPRTWMVAGPACRLPTLPKDASATSRVLPALRLQRHGFPQSTQPNSFFCHMTLQRPDALIEPTVHLFASICPSGLRGAPLCPPPGPMEQDAIVCKSPFNSLSRHLLEQSLNRPMVRSPEQED